MSFDTVTFWLFLPVALAAWRLLPFDVAKSAMVGLSLLYYGWWNPWFVLLIAFSASVDYWTGSRIHAAQELGHKRRWLIVSLAANLGLLAVLKYTPFVAENLEVLLGRTPGDSGWDFSDWIIPVGISFYTFQTLSYSIDIYRGHLKPAQSFRDFLLFVSFFPQLAAGPIVRARLLLPQFQRRSRLSVAKIQAGIYYIALGMFLKVVVADNLAPVVNVCFTKKFLVDLTPSHTWLAAFYFLIQVFADFAGYSSIAIGLAHLMGLKFPENFRWPFISRSFSEFWRRWHISLSEWLRDYVYISMGGNRKGRIRTLCFLMITMTLGGLWHGASWTFIAWGAIQGLALCVEHLLRRRSPTVGVTSRPTGPLDLLVRLAQIGAVFIFAVTTFVLCRAPDFEIVGMMISRMYIAPFNEPLGLEVFENARHLILVLPVFALHIGQLAREWYGVRASGTVQACTTAFLFFLICIVDRNALSQFFYFQF